jgi:hypothetical protein
MKKRQSKKQFKNRKGIRYFGCFFILTKWCKLYK